MSLWPQKISTPSSRRIYAGNSKGQEVSKANICKAKYISKTGITSGMGLSGDGLEWGGREVRVKKINVERVWIFSGITDILGH